MGPSRPYIVVMREGTMRPAGTIMVIWVGWTLVGLVFALRTYLDRMYSGPGSAFGQALAPALIEAYLWAVLTPAVLWLARRFPLDRRGWVRGLAVHVPVGVVVAIAAFAGFTTIAHLFSLAPVRPATLVRLHTGLLYYWGIVALGHGLQHYRRYQQQELAATRLRSQLTEARLTLLQARLHPHFLFNTLNTVAELIHEAPHRAEIVVEHLSVLLRSALDRAEQQDVPLAEELDFVRRYLAIEETRFEDRLRVEIDVSADLMGQRVPSLILQPLVENAVRHGVGPRAGPGLVRLRAARNDATLRLAVEDDGLGFDPEASARGSGIGLRATRERLVERYGAAAGLEITRPATGGTRVTLYLPATTG